MQTIIVDEDLLEYTHTMIDGFEGMIRSLKKMSKASLIFDDLDVHKRLEAMLQDAHCAYHMWEMSDGGDQDTTIMALRAIQAKQAMEDMPGSLRGLCGLSTSV